MTTTPTASPELPDLDRRTNGMTDSELIAYCQSHCETERALFNEDQVNRMIHLAGYPDWCVRKVTGWMSAHGSMAKLCELALARRAQPEGEAPQAVPDVYRKVLCMPEGPAVIGPAAQHAESGAPVALDGYIYRNAAAALAAQSQGAPAAVVGWEQRINAVAPSLRVKTKEQAMEAEIAAWRALAAQSQGAPVARFHWSKRGMEQDPNGYYVPFSAIAAKAEAPAVVFTNDGREPDWKCYAEAERAQQAAAPGVSIDTPEFCDLITELDAAHEEVGGTRSKQAWAALVAHIDARIAAARGALDADEMTRLRRLIHALGMDGSTNASDDQVRGLLFTALGQAAGKIKRANSAPGTPEAPAEEDALTVRVPTPAYLWLMGMGDDGFVKDREGNFWYRGAFNERAGLDMVDIDAKYRAAIQRAAQLDGGAA